MSPSLANRGRRGREERGEVGIKVLSTIASRLWSTFSEHQNNFGDGTASLSQKQYLQLFNFAIQPPLRLCTLREGALSTGKVVGGAKVAILHYNKIQVKKKVIYVMKMK